MILELFLILAISLALLVYKDRRPKGFPPGPFEIPFLGNLKNGTVFDCDGLLNLRKQYGDIVGTRFNIRNIILYDYHVAKEVMASADFVNRPSFFSDFSLDDKKKGGILVSNGEQWQHDRRFALRNLRNLGMGKSYLESAIHIEAQAVVDDLKLFKGEAVELPICLKTAPLNMIWQMVAGHRYDLRSEEVQKITKILEDARRNFGIRDLLAFAFAGFARKIPKALRYIIFGADNFEKLISAQKGILIEAISDHQRKFGTNEQTDDLIYEYLEEMKVQENEENPKAYHGSLLQIINDLFGAGSDTVYHSLRWTVFLMARYPEITKKAQQQIDENLPRSQLVSLDDKPSLPLVEAWVLEALRFASILIVNVQREAVKDSYIRGYFVPKGTMVIAANHSIHRDPRYWENPDEFNPMRFIDSNGKFQPPKEGFMVFGAGRRQCVGETLARMEYFLISAAIMQNFDILMPEGVELKDGCAEILGLRSPPDQKYVFKPRSL